MYKNVIDKILYQATNRDYKIGDKIIFGKERNGQAERVFAQNFKILNTDLSPDQFLKQKISKNELLTMEEMKALQRNLFNYEFCLREIGMEICRKKISRILRLDYPVCF